MQQQLWKVNFATRHRSDLCDSAPQTNMAKKYKIKKGTWTKHKMISHENTNWCFRNYAEAHKVIFIYIYKNKLSLCVCLSSDVMFVCRLTSCFRLTKLQTGTSGHKWRPGHRHIGNINDDRDTQRESDRDTRNVRLAITINKAPGHKWRPGHREYKWRPGHK